MEKIVRELKGHSGSKIYLMQDGSEFFVRKINNIERNAERLSTLSGLINVPKIRRITNDTLDMEYIRGLDMRTYLAYNNPNRLIDFLLDSFGWLAYNTADKDYTNTYHKKLDVVDWNLLPFSKDDLIKRLPLVLPQSSYLGDLTLENIIYDRINDRFVFIDPITSEYDSFVFDLAKLNQDLVCKWFIRNTNSKIGSVLLSIREGLAEKYNKYVRDDNLTILMLLRVLPYCQTQFDRDFILSEVKRLW